jgi:tripartite-type tricarboxylate transporter receptor subunit TctC
MKRRDFVKYSLASSAAVTLPFPAFGYPDRPIKLVVPFAAGGVNDVVGRQWAEQMKTTLGTVYVENIGGGGGVPGVMDVKRADPDGHTVVFGSTTTMLLHTMTKSNLGYDPNRDFVPVAIFCVSTVAIAVHPSVPATNVKELVAHAKANVGKMSYGSAGTGTMSHLAAELFKLKTGMKDVVHVPYKGGGPAMADLISGHIPIMTPNVTNQILGLHKSGKVRLLAVAAQSRLKGAPEIPTAIEQGVPDMVGQLFLGIFAPAATPKAAVDAMSAATRKVMANEAFQKTLIASGFEPVAYFTAEEARRYMAQEHARWKPVVESIGLKTG